MTISVIGLGKIGLPLAVQYAMKGESVIGVDINQRTVDFVNIGVEPFPEEENLKGFLSKVVVSQKLNASTQTSESVAKSDVVVVAVPLFVNDFAEPDFSAIDSATIEIAKGLKKGTLVAYETTLPIGTTRNRFTKLLEKISKLKVGEDFYVVFSPERVMTGRVFADLRRYPKIVGGVTSACTTKGVDFYCRVLDFDSRKDLERENGVWPLENSEAAEFVKLAETTYRDVNIALANQFAKYADKIGLNVYDVISASNSQPFSHIHQPGVAVGGHCIPVYPQFYLWNDSEASVVRAGRENNSDMPDYVARKVHDAIKGFQTKKILILGASYRDRVKELAFSGVFPLYLKLVELGYSVEVYDPLFADSELTLAGLQPLVSQKSEFGAIVIQNSAKEFLDFIRTSEEWKMLELIYDGRNLFGGVSPLKDVRIIGLGLGK
jgi:nucleotide sugar dehydrogenase